MKIKVLCDYCGAELLRYPSLIKPRNFSNRRCLGHYASKTNNSTGYAAFKDYSVNSARMSEMNKELNPARMTAETREKLSNARFNTGSKTRYLKKHGRHLHRTVAEQKIGRPLKPGEVVHHIDGNTRNNSPDNLEVLPSQAEHARRHYKGGGF